MRRWPFVKKFKFSQRNVLWTIIGITVVVLVYAYGVLPLTEAARGADEEIALKRRVLLKYREVLQSRDTLEKELDQALMRYGDIQQRLLSGETAQLGSAHLQEIVKKLSEKNGIGIRSFRILEPKEMNVYRRISLQIDFNPTPSMLSLSQFIYDIEQHEKELSITEMDLLVVNPRMPSNIQGNLVISGLMKVLDREKGKEK